MRLRKVTQIGIGIKIPEKLKLTLMAVVARIPIILLTAQ